MVLEEEEEFGVFGSPVNAHAPTSRGTEGVYFRLNRLFPDFTEGMSDAQPIR